MTKKNSQSCQYALNKFKIAELSSKSKLNLLQTAIDQRKSFRSLTLLINKAKANVDELKTKLDAMLKESPNSSSTSSVMERCSNLLSRLEKFEHEIDSLDDDGLLSQSSTRIRDDVSVTTHTTARYPTSRRCSPSMNEIPEASKPEPSSFSNKTPPLPPRPEKPSLFLSECHTTKPMLSKFLNGDNENPLSMGMSRASIFRPIKIENTLESKTEVKHSDKNFAKPETTVAKTLDRFALSDTTLSAVDNFTVNQQQLKADNDSVQPLSFVSTQNKIQNHFPQENFKNQCQSKHMLSEFLRDIAEERFQRHTFEPKSMGCSKYKGTHNSRLMNPSSVKYYSQENAQNLDFDPQQTKQPIELSYTMTNFNQFSENSSQNANNFQTSNIFSLPLHSGQELKNTENKILPGNFTQFQPQSQVKTEGIEPLNPFGVQQTACSKTITESVPIAHSISTFPPQALASVEQNPESQLPHSHQFSSVLHPISNERFRHPSFEINSLPWTSNTAPYWQNPTSKHSINLPHLTIQNFNGNPLKYH